MLSAAPSVSAAAALTKYAYSVTVPNRVVSVQAVVMLTGELPVATPFRMSVKFTSPGAAVIVMELFSVALRFTVARLDFNCAPAPAGTKAKATVRKRSAKLRMKMSRPLYALEFVWKVNLSFASRNTG
jgi:hypothetical protein